MIVRVSQLAGRLDLKAVMNATQGGLSLRRKDV